MSSKQLLATLLVAGSSLIPGVVLAEKPGEAKPLFPLLSNEECWKQLPPAESGGGQPLPNWARLLARSLPRTTAAMIELDRLHRTQNTLGPVLRGKVRWVAADTNRCEYSRRYAEADLRRAGVDEAEINALAGDFSGIARPERSVLEFARQMTLEADKVSDLEVEDLIGTYGEKKVTALVQLLAYSNFQDRLLLALGTETEPGGPLPALEVKFKKGGKAANVPARVAPKGGKLPPVPDRIDDPEWRALDIGNLKGGMERQKANLGRIRVPTWEEVVKVLAKGYPPPKRPVRIKWSLVCMGYQPQLAAGWSACTSAFREEAKQDRVFEESLFWVVTRTIHCFY